MRRVESIQDEMNGVVTYAFKDGERNMSLRFDERALREVGLRALVEHAGYGHLMPTERRDVYQCDKKIGSVPPEFDPMAIKSKSFFYDARPGDFVLDGDKWVAHRSLGPGDLQAIPGFQSSEGGRSRQMEEVAALGAVFQAMANAPKNEQGVNSESDTTSDTPAITDFRKPL